MTNSQAATAYEIDPLIFRRTLGKFMTGVTIVATRDGAGKRWGMTANSFSSVSLDPPLVSICIADRSPSFSAFSESEAFGVSILSSSQQDVAMRFAKPFDDKFDGLPFDESLTAAPVLNNAVATLACRTVQRVVAGDHVILIGEVIECAFRDDSLLGYSEGRFVHLDSRADEGARVPKEGRGVDIGWLIEHDDQLLFRRDPASGRWSVPMGPLGAGTTLSDSMRHSSIATLGVPVEPQFLYSTVDVSDDRTCYVYRAVSESVPNGEQWKLFPGSEIPWNEFLHEKMIPMVKRYLEEREGDNYGIYLNLGTGRIARLEQETTWPGPN